MNKSNTIQFLECYERHPCLWNPRERDYRNTTARLEALQAIIDEMGLNITVEELKLKIKNYRTTYNREATKVANSKRSGASPDEVYTPQLIWFPVADRFLKPIIEGRINSIDNTAIDSKDSAANDASSDASPYFDDEQEYYPEPIPKRKKSAPKIKVECVQTMETPTLDPPIMDPLGYQTNKLDNSNLFAQNIRPDEYDTFGQHVANQLRSLPLENAIIGQNFINNYLTQERLKVLKAQHLSRSKGSHSDKPGYDC